MKTQQISLIPRGKYGKYQMQFQWNGKRFRKSTKVDIYELAMVDLARTIFSLYEEWSRDENRKFTISTRTKRL